MYQLTYNPNIVFCTKTNVSISRDTETFDLLENGELPLGNVESAVLG